MYSSLSLSLQVADALRHVASATARLKAALSWAKRPASVTVVCSLSVMSWLHRRLGRPLPLFPSILPSNMSFSTVMPLDVSKKFKFLTHNKI